MYVTGRARNATFDEAIVARGLPPRCLMVLFEASWQGDRVFVISVLETTAIVHPVAAAGAPDDRVLALRRPVGAVLEGVPGLRAHASPDEFRAYEATYCLECSRARQAVINRRRRRAKIAA